jgi:3-deoxy-D-manno-octulosonic-acid transferase
LWLHAVSVGEVVLLEPVLKRWTERHPDWECVISTTTQTGYALAKKKYSSPPLTTHYSPLTVIYCPLDFTWAVSRAMQRIRPTILVLAELELWPNLIAAAKRHGAKIAVINGRLGEKSFRGYRRIQPLVRPVLQMIDVIAAQNEPYAERFLALGAPPAAVAVTGSIKFDGARMDRQNEQTLALVKLAGIQADDIVFLAGSTQEPEEQLAVNVYRRLVVEFPELRLILVPRHPERFDEVAAMLDRSGLAWQRRSGLCSHSRFQRDDNSRSIKSAVGGSTQPHGITRSRPARRAPRPTILVDAVGELAAWWGSAHIAFVGGSLTRRGGQNMIEPAAYGTAVCFGPNTWNFRDVVKMLLDRDAAAVVRNEVELEAFVRRCLTDAELVTAIGRRAQELVLQQQGAAERTVLLLERLVRGQAAELLSSGGKRSAA